MSYTLINQAMTLPMPPARRAVLLTLADMANQAGACWPSIATIARRACLSVRSVFNHLKELVAAGLLTRRQRIGRASVYTVGSAAQPVATATPPDQATSAPAPTIAPVALTVGSVVQAMREVGMLGAYECTPLAALVASASYTTDGLSEFTSVAAEAASKGKGFPWVLTVIKARRADRAHADTARTTTPPTPGRDPALIKIEADAAKAAPPPQSIRERLAKLRAEISCAIGT